jgi:nucleoside 2-deoxyribosyltransferase
MKIYLAAPFFKKEEMCGIIKPMVESIGHTVTSRWLDTKTEWEFAATSVLGYFASCDLNDIDDADLVIVNLTGLTGYVRGGVHVEFGYAYAKGKPVWLLGKRVTIFHNLPAVKHFDSWDDVFEELKTYACTEGSVPTLS